MYWPVGGPRVYSASRQTLRESQFTTSEDALDSDEEDNSLKGNDNGEEVGSSGGQESAEESEEGQEEVTRISNSKNDGVAEEQGPERGPAEKAQSPDSEDELSENIIGLRLSRSGHLFASITQSTLTIWQTKPTVVLSSVIRSSQSINNYGHNVAVFIRPDSAVFVVQTSSGYLITYSLATDPNSKVYNTYFAETHGHHRRHSFAMRHHGLVDLSVGASEAAGIREMSIRFRMVIRVDAGISKVLALNDELVVTTEKPAAVQCIRWAPDSTGTQTSTELLSRMSWLEKKSMIVEMVYNRPMNLSAWLTSDGRVYAVQRLEKSPQQDPKSLFKGYCFHDPTDDLSHGTCAAINARFSLIAVGCRDAGIRVYTARNYAGDIPLCLNIVSHHTRTTTGEITTLSYSPDGYSLFVGYERGWMAWSVYGKALGSSFNADRSITGGHGEEWLNGVRDAFWTEGGSEIVLIGYDDTRLWVLETARSAILTSATPSNIARPVMQTSTTLLVHRVSGSLAGSTPSLEGSQWQHVQLPLPYLSRQWPIRCTVISADGRYIAVAGRRGLAHYSMRSGRWKTFEDPIEENSFIVRGGMFWHQHTLIAAVECDKSYQLRVYSREKPLETNQVMHVENMAAPVVTLSPSGTDSLLVYTYENILYHYIIRAANSGLQLVQVGNITLHGLIRAPPRVRALSWIVPEDQLENGDPSQDVAIATVLFLVDGKLVLLQPRPNDDGALRYEMRIIAQNVEYYALMRDMPADLTALHPAGNMNDEARLSPDGYHSNDLRDSLWYFDGVSMKVWMDVQELLATAPTELGRELAPTVSVHADFYPLSILLSRGILFGVESELVQRRDANFVFSRFAPRTHLFLPPLLRHHLAQYNAPAASHLCQYYQHLPYFPHALEVLLHDVLDDEVDTAPPAEQALLPIALAFLSAFPPYLDIVVQCTRKTEVRSWRTLFAHLPPPQELFESSLQQGRLKTAGGYLLVLHTFEELTTSSEQLLRLLRRAREERDWELCKELARFLMALDETGATLREAMRIVDLPSLGTEPDRLDRGTHEQGKGNGGGDNNIDNANSSSVGLGIAAAPPQDEVEHSQRSHGPPRRDYFSS